MRSHVRARGGADRQCIAGLFPTVHRDVFVASDRQLIAKFRGEGEYSSRHLGSPAFALPWLIGGSGRHSWRWCGGGQETLRTARCVVGWQLCRVPHGWNPVTRQEYPWTQWECGGAGDGPRGQSGNATTHDPPRSSHAPNVLEPLSRAWLKTVSNGVLARRGSQRATPLWTKHKPDQTHAH